MKPLDPSHYQKLIDTGILLTESTLKQWPEIPVERRPLAQYGQGLNALSVAVGSLMLGQPDQARLWFRKAAEGFACYSAADNVAPEMRLLECAVLCGDRGFAQQVAGRVAERQGRHLPYEYPYVIFLKHALLGQPDTALPFAQAMALASPTTAKKRGGYAALGPLCLAFAGGDPETFTAAIQTLLAEHHLKSAHGWRLLSHGILCLPGAALVILAQDKGWSIPVDTPYIPATLLDKGG